MQVGSSLNAFKFNHVPVLAQEVIESMKILPPERLKDGLVIDATLGSGGHSALILKEYPGIRIIGIDQDPHARNSSLKLLKDFGSRINVVAGNFADFTPSEKVVMILADLGVSSPQLDNPARGFSFKSEGPIDMRMNPQTGISAADLIENLNETQLANIIYNFGEERLSRRIARKIKKDLAEQGPYKNTTALAYAISGCYHPKLRHGRIHPATRTFQALRIAVNKELEVLDQLLSNAPDWLISGGLFGVISFHSLEDRKVKNCFISDERLERITRKPITATSEEISANSRSRSAKFRIGKRK
tara:strand:- start:16194 stop:17099 length:906 start_codon:yes stop_codon:yes gene_type:complete